MGILLKSSFSGWLDFGFGRGIAIAVAEIGFRIFPIILPEFYQLCVCVCRWLIINMLFLLGAWRWQLCKVPVRYVLWNCLISHSLELLKEFFNFTFMVHHPSLNHHLGHRTSNSQLQTILPGNKNVDQIARPKIMSRRLWFLGWWKRSIVHQ